MKYLLVLPILILPIVVNAGVESLLINSYLVVKDIFIPIVFALAFLFFLYGLAKYMFANADDSKIAGRQVMVWGTIALFIAASLQGIIVVLNLSLGFPDGTTTQWFHHTCLPTIGGGSSECIDTSE
jgi:hypothetical protein